MTSAYVLTLLLTTQTVEIACSFDLGFFFYQGPWLLFVVFNELDGHRRHEKIIIKTSSLSPTTSRFIYLLEYPPTRAKYRTMCYVLCNVLLFIDSSVITGYDRHCCHLFPFPHFSSPFCSTTIYLPFAKHDNASHSCFPLVLYYTSISQHGADRAIVHSEKRHSSFQPRLKSMAPLVTHGLKYVPGIAAS